jgi:lipoate-protein ligase A
MVKPVVTVPDGMIWRLLEDGERECRRHFAIEESILRGVDEGASPNTLRLRRADPSVWIGVFQRAGEDVDLAACKETGIPVVRRCNPGGSVYQDGGTFCYSAFFQKDAFLSSHGLRESQDLFDMTARVVIKTISDFGVSAEQTGVNDISIKGRKVYGAAQVEHGNAFVHSGTFLISADLDRMQRLLKPSMLKFADKGFRSVRDRVVNLSETVGRRIEVEDVMESFVNRLAAVFGISFAPGPLSEMESLLAERLYKCKYSLDEWNIPSCSSFETTVARKVPSGVVFLTVTWNDGIISCADVYGDFLLPNPAELKRAVESISGSSLEEACEVLMNSQLTVELRQALAGLVSESQP